MTMNKIPFERLYKEIVDLLDGPETIYEKLQKICKLLRDEISYYDWVGFYLVDGSKKDELVLGPFSGAPTDHKKISFGSGICGQAAALKRTFVVPDVQKETNYLSCSSSVRSEIVVPILKDGEIMGELDIDSHEISPFSHEDQEFLERICGLIEKIL
ncbi:MAG: GAF domain-containing protein [Candidatus Thermoplasmatota archaeon]|nr:GAF domain-containing protein [Candidatus Thermoplasmatota archaeon]MDP7264857.1 GAF domain-containing protein [Candidatus Thermoplasmatota archaeon]